MAARRTSKEEMGGAEQREEGGPSARGDRTTQHRQEKEEKGEQKRREEAGAARWLQLQQGCCNCNTRTRRCSCVCQCSCQQSARWSEQTARPLDRNRCPPRLQQFAQSSRSITAASSQADNVASYIIIASSFVLFAQTPRGAYSRSRGVCGHRHAVDAHSRKKGAALAARRVAQHCVKRKRHVTTMRSSCSLQVGKGG